MTRVKICGISHSEHALAAAGAGADLIGVVFAESKRKVDVERAKEIIAQVKRLANSPDAVGVFVNTPAIDVNRTAEDCELDWVQLSGDEPFDYIGKIAKPVIKAIKVSQKHTSKSLLEELNRWSRHMESDSIFLLDCDVAGSYGGSGQAFDWSVAQASSKKYPLIIAGGLSPENVSEAVRIVKPWGVDVSSGVESEGVKDTAKIKEFITAVRREDGR
jgi:phosphoribosylanthranilate isomerase